MNYLKILIITIAIASGSGSVVSQAEDFDVYVLTGQSNSLGTTGLEGAAPNYEPGANAADANTRFFWSNATTALPQTFPPSLYGDSGGVISSSLQMQQGDGGANPFFWGPEYGFARQMAENSGGKKILIIKASRGGGGNSLWDKSTFDLSNSNGHMWGHVRNTVDAGLGQLTTGGDTFSVKGLIYMQGESNSGTEAGIAGTRLSNLSSDLKAHINSNWAGAANSMYTVAAEIAASSANADRIQTTTLQRNLGRNDTGFGFVSTSDQSLKSDNIHFGRDAKLTYGSRIADAFNSQSFTENANTIAGYSARPKVGSPIPDPTGQGLSFGGSGAGVTVHAINDGGTQAWRLFDNSAASNPGYRQELRNTDFSRMFDIGWKFTANAKVVSGGGLALWSTSQNDDPGWNLTDALNMNGFQLNRINGNQLEVKLWSSQATFNLGAGSADAFHKFEMIGAAGSPLYDFYIDGQLQSAGLDLRTGLGNAGFNDMLIFNSGSTGGTGLDVYWNEVSLTAVTSVPEPAMFGLLGSLFCISVLLRRKRCAKSSPSPSPCESGGSWIDWRRGCFRIHRGRGGQNDFGIVSSNRLIKLACRVGLIVSMLAAVGRAEENAFPQETEKLKVACVGDSITFGLGIEDRDSNSYPALLQKMLGEKYEVGNFGFSGATLLKKGHKPYWVKPPYADSLKFNPDIVIVNLGANDVVDTNWQHAGEFADDYAALIESYRNLPSKPKIFICEITPIFPNHGRFDECTKNRKQLTPLIRGVAKATQANLIDLFSPFIEKNGHYPDGLHPNAEGAGIMAGLVYTSLTGKRAPVVKLAQQELLNDESGTSFENIEAGVFQSINTKVGVWKSTAGIAVVDNEHPKSGSQCLQLTGGDKTVVELQIAKGIKTAGQLSFWAERWTSVDPFSFRIEKFASGKWTEILNGDATIPLGRAYRAQVIVPLNDDGITRLRFSCTSPPNKGILIDDLKITPLRPQRVARMAVAPLTLPALVGTPASALLKLRVDVEGTLDPLSVTNLAATLGGTTDVKDIDTAGAYYSGSNANFSTATPFGKPLKPRASGELNLSGDQPLAEGENYFWIACTLNKNANIDHRVGAALSQVTVSNNESIVLNSESSIQRMGIAVRQGGDDNVHTYRIPGLATTTAGTLIGVYDVRHSTGGDLPGHIDVGMSRSSDGGRTWEPMKVIMDMGNDPKFNHDGIGDPSVMVDTQTGTIWCAALWSHGNRGWNGSGPGMEPAETGQFVLVKSDDDGKTWSQPINVTPQIKNPVWCLLLQGPGKGVTMSDGTLVMPAQYQDSRANGRLPRSTFIYSRDHGQSWDIATAAYDDTTEAQIVELENGQLMLNCRYNREGKRVVMTTDDMGKTWQAHSTNRKSLIEPGACQASLINVGRETGNSEANGLLLFSNPNSTAGRNHMTIKSSSDYGQTWPETQQVLLDEQGSAGYSCLTMIDRDTVGILYEGSQSHMTFQRIPLKEILQANQAEKKPLSFSRVFGDHMVLQANGPIRVWGTASPDTQVQVSLGDSVTKISSNLAGNWQAELPALPYTDATASLQLSATSGQSTITINDVLIGEVWFCAGQSNMEWPLSQSAGAAEALDESHDSQLRLMNFVGAARGGAEVYGPELMERLDPKKFSNGAWVVSNPTTAREFSAVAFYFARKLRCELNCPVGVINVSSGGTPIEAWISESTLQSNSQLAPMVAGNWLDNPVLDDWCKTRARANLKRGLAGEFVPPGNELGPDHPFKPGFMYQSAVEPFALMSIAGVLWYQGESNAETPERIRQYDEAFPLLISSWRTAFQNSDLPVAFVQLPAMGRPHWPMFRELQRRSLGQLENVGMAVTIDTGHPTNVHPTNKRPVGERLAQWALVSQYDKQGPAMGPNFKSQYAADHKLTLSFDSVGKTMKTKDGKPPSNFEMAGADSVFHAAEASIEQGSQIVLNSSAVGQPVYARYGWAPFPKTPPNLVNSIGLPASPFTTQENFLNLSDY